MGLIYKCKSKILNFLSNIRVYPLGIVLYGQTGYKVKGEHTRKILDLIKPGDVLLTRWDYYLGYFFIPGYWGHAGLYVGDNRVIHMLGDGITNEDILTFLRKDHVMLLRSYDQAKAALAVEHTKKLWDERVSYDFDFSSGNDTYYCSEMIWFVYDKDPKIKYKLWVMPANLICSLFYEVCTVP